MVKDFKNYRKLTFQNLYCFFLNNLFFFKKIEKYIFLQFFFFYTKNPFLIIYFERKLCFGIS